MGLEIIGEEKKPLSWSEFETHVHKDIESAKIAKAESKHYHSDWVYRGHSNAEWPLITSLERYQKEELGEDATSFDPIEYYCYLGSVVPAINSLTERKFEHFNPSEVSVPHIGSMPYYELLCFARHLGFPSPLLDWTMSYYIAAFFAFKNAKQGRPAAIFAYKEWNGEARGGWVADPMMGEQGPIVETHARHYRQQSTYTICRAELDGKTVFMQHELAVEINPGEHNIKKFVLDAKERKEVLKRLYRMNINDYTLFGDEESLMRTLAFKAFHNL